LSQFDWGSLRSRPSAAVGCDKKAKRIGERKRYLEQKDQAGKEKGGTKKQKTCNVYGGGAGGMRRCKNHFLSSKKNRKGEEGGNPSWEKTPRKAKSEPVVPRSQITEPC